MKKPIQISIPTPCHENWDAMTPADKGRFCASCQKTVFDFTKSSDREIASILKNTDNACGRFRITQLDRDLVVPKEKSSLWIAASAAVVSFLTLGNHGVFAQETIQTEYQNNHIIGDTIVLPVKRQITGTVIDAEGIPIPGANVIIKGTERTTFSDFDGNFAIEVNNNEIILFTYVGMKNLEMVVTDLQNYNVRLTEDTDEHIVYMEGNISFTQRTFFGRIFRSIGNIFR